MLNIRTVILSVALVAMLLLAVPLVTARTEVVSDPSSDPVIALDHQDRYDKMNKVPIPSYRSPLDVCYDMPLSEAAACRTESQPLVPSRRSSYRYELDECSDVSLMELASCRKASQVSIPSYRSPLDECFDVSISELAGCRSASQESTP